MRNKVIILIFSVLTFSQCLAAAGSFDVDFKMLKKGSGRVEIHFGNSYQYKVLTTQKFIDSLKVQKKSGSDVYTMTLLKKDFDYLLTSARKL